MSSVYSETETVVEVPLPERKASESSTISGSTVMSASSKSAPNLPTSVSFWASFKDWWGSSGALMKPSSPRTAHSKSIADARLKNRQLEYELFRAILSDDIYIKQPHSASAATPNKVADFEGSQLTGELLDISVDDNVTIHEFYLQNGPDVPEEDQTHIVIVHGYMAASGYFIKNIESLLKSKRGVRLHLIDLPGFGNSSRPRFPRHFLTEPESASHEINQVLEVENWFIDRLELWRKKRGIRSFKLIGHSMGAYLSSCYLMKYNNGDKVQEFVVVSPMGTESSDVSLLSKHHTRSHESGGDPFQELQPPNDEDHLVNEDLENLWEKMGRPSFPKSAILEKIWKNHKSPFQILQLGGPFYSKALSFWTFQRFRNLRTNEEEEEIGSSIKLGSKEPVSSTDLILKLHKYSYSIFNQYQASGELAITKFISHEILAKLPLCDRGFADYLKKNKVKTLWLYGDRDWMNHKGGKYIWEQLNTEESLSEFKIVRNAGHHIYLDNPVEFNEEVIRFFDLQHD